MALTEEVITLMDGVDPKGNIRVKRVTRILKDGVAYGPEQYHRHVLAPGDDLTGQDPQVVAAAKALWTPQNVKAFTAEFVADMEAQRTERKKAVDGIQKEIEKEEEKTKELALMKANNEAFLQQEINKESAKQKQLESLKAQNEALLFEALKAKEQMG